MEIKKILEEKISITKSELRNEIEYIEKIRTRKEEIKNGDDADLTKSEKELLEFKLDPVNIPKKITRLKRSPAGSWMEFLTPEERQEISGMESDNPRFQRIRGACYTRRYYSNPDNLKLQYQRNKRYNDTQKEKRKDELLRSLPSVMEERKNNLLERREKEKEKSRKRFHDKKIDPEFLKKDREKSKKFRDEHKNYMKIRSTLMKARLLPLSVKAIERRNTIQKNLSQYKTASEFRISCPKDYNWIIANGLRKELLGIFPEIIRRKEYTRKN